MAICNSNVRHFHNAPKSDWLPRRHLSGFVSAARYPERHTLDTRADFAFPVAAAGTPRRAFGEPTGLSAIASPERALGARAAQAAAVRASVHTHQLLALEARFTLQHYAERRRRRRTVLGTRVPVSKVIAL